MSELTVLLGQSRTAFSQQQLRSRLRYLLSGFLQENKTTAKNKSTPALPCFTPGAITWPDLRPGQLLRSRSWWVVLGYGVSTSLSQFIQGFEQEQRRMGRGVMIKTEERVEAENSYESVCRWWQRLYWLPSWFSWGRLMCSFSSTFQPRSSPFTLCWGLVHISLRIFSFFFFKKEGRTQWQCFILSPGTFLLMHWRVCLIPRLQCPLEACRVKCKRRPHACLLYAQVPPTWTSGTHPCNQTALGMAP